MKGGAAALVGMLVPDGLQSEKDTDKKAPPFMQIVLTHNEAEALTLRKMDKHVIDDDKVVHRLMELGIVKNPKWDMFVFRRSLAGLSVFKKGFCGNVVKEFTDDGEWNNARRGEPMTVANVQRRFWDRASAHIAEEIIKIRTKEKNGIELSMTEKGEKENFPVLFGPLDQIPLAPFDMAKLNVKDDKAIEKIARQSPKIDLIPVFRKLGISEDIMHINEQDLRDIGIHVEERVKGPEGKSWAERSASSPSAPSAYVKQ